MRIKKDQLGNFRVGTRVKFNYADGTGFSGTLEGIVIKVSQMKNLHVKVENAPHGRKKPYILPKGTFLSSGEVLEF